MRRVRRSKGGAGIGEDGPPLAEKINIPTDILRTFVAICELGNFTKAAHLLGVSQPAVSTHMRRLESFIGADLFQKGPTGAVLTECGADVLRNARRLLAINDQIVHGSGVEVQPKVVRVGIPNIYAPTMLAKILSEGAAFSTDYRLQVRCDYSSGLFRSVSSGYLELAAVQFVNETELAGALATWIEELVWVKSPDLVFNSEDPVPLVGSPNMLLPDQVALAALEAANRRYEIVFTAFDTLARRSAAAAGLGYFAVPRSVVAEPLVIEAPGILPELPHVNMGIVARDDLDTALLAPLIARIGNIFSMSARGAS
jgi:DNA-binding transcriptional LysR family regulator